MAALAKAGHHAIYHSTKERGFKKALKQPTDLVLAAGGDGTTAKVAHALVDSGVPLSVLPLGTANNLARALGFVASPEEIIARLEGGKKRAFDVGLAYMARGVNAIFLKLQAGLLADYVRVAKKDRKKHPRLTSFPKNKRWRGTVRSYDGCCTIIPRVNGRSRLTEKDISGRTSLGSQIFTVGPPYLAPHAATRDGRFDFCVCTPGRLRPLAKHFDARVAGKKRNRRCPRENSVNYGSFGRVNRVNTIWTTLGQMRNKARNRPPKSKSL